MKTMLLRTFLLLLMPLSVFSQNAYPEILTTDVEFSQITTTFSIDYTFTDIDNSVHEIDLLVSMDNGVTFASVYGVATGDIGTITDQNGTKNIQYNIGSIDVEETILRLVITDNEEVDIQSIVDAVDTERLTNYLTDIEGIRHRTAGLDHLQEVQEQIKSEHEGNGIVLEVLEFDFAGYTAQNILGHSIGMLDPNEIYFVGGHYDGVSVSPGADDNGTAIAAMLEASKVLSAYNFDKSISYVAWDLEEAGLRGSIDYVTNHVEDVSSIKGYINFEMIGYYDDSPNAQSLPTGFEQVFPDAFMEISDNEFRGDFLSNVGNQSSSTGIMTDFETIAGIYVPALKIISIASPGDGSLVPDLQRSDHAAFWGAGIPAVMLTDGADFRNPYYHSMDDSSDKLDMDFFTNNVKAAVAYLAEKAEVNHSTFKDLDVDNIVVSVQDAEANLRLNIYPNPAKDLISVETDNSLATGKAQYLIYNASGQVLNEGQHDFSTTDVIKVKVSDLPAGMYYFQLQNSENLLGGQFFTLE